MRDPCTFCGLGGCTPCATESAAEICKADSIQAHRDVTPIGDVAELGVIQFHGQPELRDRFYHVVDDLRRASCIVDLWLMDLASVMREHGYDLTIRRTS